MRLAIIAVIVMLAGHVRAAVLCTRSTGSGTVRVREVCKTNEVQIDPVVLGLVGPSGSIGPTGPAGRDAPAFVVKDSNGAFVGTVVDLNVMSLWGLHGWGLQLARIVRTVNGRVVQFLVGTDAIAGPSQSGFVEDGGVAHFESTDCTGPPLLSPGQSRLGQMSVGNSSNFVAVFELYPNRYAPLVPAVSVKGMTGYYQVGDTVVRSTRSLRFSAVSEQFCRDRQGSFAPPDKCCVPQPSGNEFAEMGEIDLSTLGLVPPFHVEVAGQ